MQAEVREEIWQLADGESAAVLVLQAATGATARLIPSLGGNVISWTVPTASEPRELFWHDPSQLAATTAIKQGNPILFPFVNRLRDANFSWQGRTYNLERNCPRGLHAIHGFVHTRRWRAAGVGTHGPSAWVEAEIEIEPDLWPGALKLRVRTTLEPNVLRQEFHVLNPATVPVPFALGLHPYFRFTPDTTALTIDRPTAELAVWELRDCMPVGGKLPLRGKMLRFVQAHQRPLGENRYDDVLHLGGKRPAIWRMQSDRGETLEMATRGGFREFVIFTPPHRQAICLEPYTAMTDAFHLHARNLDSGLRVLGPGEGWHGEVRLTFSAQRP